MTRQLKDACIKWSGNIPADWNSVALKYLCDMQAGKNLSAEQIADEGEYPVYGGNGLRGFFFDFNTNGHYLLVGRQGALCGNVHQVEGKFWATEHAVVTKCTSLAEIRFLYYLLIGMELNQYASNTAAQPGLSVSEIGNVRTCLVPLAEQRRIAAFLDRKCAEIDAVIERTKATIEEYKKLKQAVITEAVTKGVRGARPMKDSGAQWVGSIPADWMVYRIANLYDERSEEGAEELPILTVSINTGVSDHEVADEDKDRVFVRIEDRTKYKRVYPGDLTYNMMRAWQGAFGAVRVHGMVSPAYVIAKPKETVKLDSRYMEALLRTKQATEEMHRYSRGIVDFRLRLYWPEFKNIRVCLPSYEEQKEIADYIDEKSTSMDTLIAKKTALLTELETYKKSLIYEYVTGKKEVGA